MLTQFFLLILCKNMSGKKFTWLTQAEKSRTIVWRIILNYPEWIFEYILNILPNEYLDIFRDTIIWCINIWIYSYMLNLFECYLNIQRGQHLYRLYRGNSKQLRSNIFINNIEIFEYIQSRVLTITSFGCQSTID